MYPGMEDLNSKLNMFFVLRGIKFRQLSAELGLHQGQAPILDYIWTHSGCTQKEIADCMMISPASVAVSTKRLQKAGFLEKQTDENNLRCNMLRLTQRGKDVARRFKEELSAFEDRILDGVTEADRKATERVMDQILDNFCKQEHLVPESIFSRKEGMQCDVEKTASKSKGI